MVRFQKRISIAKGIRLNVGKSGLGLSTGIPGASISLGPKGVYSNLGIAGTGISQRTKIAGTGGKSTSTATRSSSKESYDFSTINLKVEEDGTITFSDHEGNAVDDETIGKYKRTPIYREKVRSISEEYHQTLMEETQKFVDIFRYAPFLINEEQWQNRIDELTASLQDGLPFTKLCPSREVCIQELEQKSEKEVSSSLFWRKRSLREEYVTSNISAYYSSKFTEWEKEKAEYEEEQRNTQQLTQNEIDHIKYSILTGDEQYVTSAIDNLIEQTQLPVNFLVDYSYSPPDTLQVDLDLPEIEDLNTKSSKILKSGKISVKEKSQKELRQDYARCVCGLSFFIAGNLFNVSPKISKVIISGYTQRVAKKTGQLEEEYLFSEKIDRAGYAGINFALADPIEAVKNFDNVMDITPSFEMRSITPY